MGLHHILLQIDWLSIICALVHILSASSLPTLTRIVITHMHFDHATTLAFVQSATVVICLWLWTIMNVFRPRMIPLGNVIPLALSAALNAILQAHCLSALPLLQYQLVRLLPLALLAPGVQSIPFLIGILLMFVSNPPSPFALAILVATVAASIFDRTGPILSLRRATRATDLQLQLSVRTLSTVFVLPVMALLDDFSEKSALPARLLGVDEETSFIVFSTGMLCFLTFAVTRVSNFKLNPNAFRAASLLTAVPVFVAHFVVYEAPSIFDILCLLLVLCGAGHSMVMEVSDLSSDEESDSDIDSYSDDSFSLSSVSDLGTIMVPPLQLSHASIPVNGSSRLDGTSSAVFTRSTSLSYSVSV